MSTSPERYREVSVTDVDVALEAGALRTLLMSRPVYRRTRFMVVRAGGRAALVEVMKASTATLFAEVTDVLLLAGPDETAYVHRADVDTAVASAVAQVARELVGVRCVVVEGRYGHVSFILDADPVTVHVLDVAPPHPAKLVDQLLRVLATADDLPAVVTVPHVIELLDLIPAAPGGSWLLPCRGGTVDVPGAEVAYLDEVPPRADWTLLGCARSRAIHDALYDAPLAAQVDTCPRTLATRVGLPEQAVLLTKCCLLETQVETDGRTVVVPWGASFAELRQGLAIAVGLTAG